MFEVFRGVAQLGSALAWGARGRWFESSRPDIRGNYGIPLDGACGVCNDYCRHGNAIGVGL